MFINRKHRRILKVLAANIGSVMVARWDQQELRDLHRMGFVEANRTINKDGELSAYQVWGISERGLAEVQLAGAA